MHKPLEQEKRMGIKEFFSLLWINFVVTMRNFIEFIKVAFRYYGNLSFLKADIALRLMYFFHNPFSISKRFLMNKGEENIYAYGETPLTTLEKIAREAGIESKDCVYELGAGRGKGCFWLNTIIGCSVVGIEYIPEFVERANRIKNRLRLSRIEFCLDDILKADLTGATVCYLYGTCLEDTAIKRLIRKFSMLPEGTKIITVSYPLSDYLDNTDHSSFELVKHFTAPYTWGEADIYVQIVTKSNR